MEKFQLHSERPSEPFKGLSRASPGQIYVLESVYGLTKLSNTNWHISVPQEETSMCACAGHADTHQGETQGHLRCVP